jgi:hypothetical protein
MKEANLIALGAEFSAAVIAQINDDRQHGWSAKDSMAVVEAIVAKDAELTPPDMLASRFTLSDEAQSFILKVINPSQFRQVLESEKRPDGQTILAKSDKKAVEKSVFAIYKK